MLGERLALLDPSGTRIAGAATRTAIYQQAPICLDRHCRGSTPLGYIRLNAPVLTDSASDAFFLRGQYASLVGSAPVVLLMSALAAYLIAHYNVLAQTLAQSARAEREWISNTSHELQTPLAVLRAQIEALQDGVRKPDAATLAEMHAAQMRLSRLVQDLKVLSYSREPQLAAHMARADLVEIATEAVETARPALTAAGIDIHCEFPASLVLGCDRSRIAQVIDNLLQNTRRYTDAPGTVRLQIARKGGFVQLSIDDTPPAPPGAMLPRIFDRFSRAEESRSRALGGSGLGLAVCKAIVEAHGGTITAAKSDLGGLNITITLPERQR